MKTFAALLIGIGLTLGLGGCSKSSPTEPSFAASLHGFVHFCPQGQGGTLRVVDSSGSAQSTVLDAGGNFSFGTVFVIGPYDAYFDTAGKPETQVAMHGQDSSSPVMKAGSNEFYLVLFSGCM